MRCALLATLTALSLSSTAPATAQVIDDEPIASDVVDMAKTLELSTKQRQAIRDVKDDIRKVTVQLKANIEVVGIDLRRELEKPSPDTSRIGKLVDKISAFEGNVRKAHILGNLKVRSVLTAKQRVKLEALHRRRGPGPDEVDRMVAATQMKRAAMARKLAEKARREAELAHQDMERDLRKAEEQLRQAKIRLKGARAAELHKRKKDRAHKKVDAQTGRLRINAKPHADIYIDGRKMGVTPIQIKLKPGKHIILLRKDGYRSQSQRVTIKAGESTNVIVRLKKDSAP